MAGIAGAISSVLTVKGIELQANQFGNWGPVVAMFCALVGIALVVFCMDNAEFIAYLLHHEAKARTPSLASVAIYGSDKTAGRWGSDNPTVARKVLADQGFVRVGEEVHEDYARLGPSGDIQRAELTWFQDAQARARVIGGSKRK